MTRMTAPLQGPDPLPRYWCAGDPFETRFLEAMSLLAPEVERFVISAVRANVARAADPAVVRGCRAFIREEADHSRVHNAFNRRLAGQRIDLPRVLARVRRLIRLAERWVPPSGRLEVAAACEHLSALLSLWYLRSARKDRIASAETRRMFESHAREEIAHRAFVFDLLRQGGGGKRTARVLALAAVSLAGLWCTLRMVGDLSRRDARRDVVFRPRGVFRLLRSGDWVPLPALLRGWLTFVGPRFHPSQLPEA
jgi:predicted metal-dependent hydrolase